MKIKSMRQAGRHTSITENGAGRENRYLMFAYDKLYRLTSETDSQRNGGAAVVYTYDDFGNRLTRTDNGVETVYTVDKLNRVTAARTLAETIAWTYDANGNTATKTEGDIVQTYHYDRENRLTGVTVDAETVFSAKYDYRSRRVEKTENGDTVSYLYDGGVSV